jgi:hypothetical protein
VRNTYPYEKKEEGDFDMNRESLELTTPKRRKKEGVKDWEIHLYLLEMPASVATPPAKRSLMSLRTTTTPS